MTDPNEPLRPGDEQDLFFQLFEFAPDALLVFDERGNVKQANARTEEAFGYARSEMIGRPVETLVTGQLSPFRRAEMPGVGIRKDGTEFPIDIVLSPVKTRDGQVMVVALRNSRENRQADELAAQVSRSATLLKEVHHRVKNNLQIISSLLHLRSLQDANPAVTRVLQECQARVRSIALIHEKLYRSPVYGKLNFADYIDDFVAELIRTYQVPGEKNKSQNTSRADASGHGHGTSMRSYPARARVERFPSCLSGSRIWRSEHWTGSRSRPVCTDCARQRRGYVRSSTGKLLVGPDARAGSCDAAAGTA